MIHSGDCSNKNGFHENKAYIFFHIVISLGYFLTVLIGLFILNDRYM